MKILLTGAKGQLGTDFVKMKEHKYDIVGLDHTQLDISSLKNVLDVTKQVNPDLIINLAAYNDVDKCEENKDLGYKVNTIGARNLAIASLERETKIMHISTDYVFDGLKESPYTEFDDANPINHYGKSKLEGEKIVRDIAKKFYIVRTSWLYGSNGKNFVKTMLELSKKRKQISVVDDQVGSPTYTMDLIEGLEKIISTEAYGTYHFSNDGECSWNEFAKEVYKVFGIDMHVNSINSLEYGAPAKRPSYSVLENYMMKLEFDYKVRHWKDALKDFYKEF